jgi:hypothetical protein
LQAKRDFGLRLTNYYAFWSARFMSGELRFCVAYGGFTDAPGEDSTACAVPPVVTARS